MLRTAPNSVAARLLRDFPAPAPDRGSDGRYLDQRELATPGGTIPAIGRANVLLSDNVRFDQYFGRVDHVLGSKQRLSARWIGEHQRDEGGTSSAAATLGRALRGSRGPFHGFFGNLNVGAQQILGRAVNDARVSLPDHRHDARRRGRRRPDRQHHRHHRAVRRRLREHDAAAARSRSATS